MNPCYSRSGFQKLFARSGASYGAPMWKYRRRADWLMQTLELDAGMTVMDLGCHDGRLLSLLPPELDRVGLDVDATVLARAGSAHPGIRFVRGDLDAADNTGSAQVVTLFHVLEHLRDPVGTLRRLHETSPPGTRLVVEVPVLGAARDADINGFFSVHHLTHFTEHHLIECVEAAGWRVTCLAREDAYNAVRLVAQTCGPRQPR
ncbi:MAG TPA: class I SAM-dependent methyltransferase, partial [Gammaproteobacteria bacterium]|nr:class I SAM-dependent methyltransferase [Gammaproteobacteria bacterium]